MKNEFFLHPVNWVSFWMTAYLFITKVGVRSQHPRVPKVSKYLPLFE